MKKTFVKPQATAMPMQTENLLQSSGTKLGISQTSYSGPAFSKQSANGFNWN